MTKLRYYQLVVGILIGFNLITCFFLWPKQHHPYGRPPKNVLVDHLGLSGKIRSEVLKMQASHFERKEKLIFKNHRMHLHLFHLAKQTNLDNLLRDKYLRKIGDIQQNIDRETFEYFRAVNNLCNKEQKEKLKEMLRRVFLNPTGQPPKKN